MADTRKAIGGYARAKSLSAAERSEIASKGGTARWEKEKELPKASYRGEVQIEGVTIACAVLDDNRRVVSEHAINSILGSAGGSIYKRRDEMNDINILTNRQIPLFLALKSLQPHMEAVFDGSPLDPIEYKDGRRTLTGYPATILPKVCEVWLRARDAGDLQTQQLLKAQKAEMLMRGLAHIGIIALVDEATGYQESRDRQALHKLLEMYLSEERLAWAKKFPDEFYHQIYRLKGWTPSTIAHQRPGCLGHITNQLVYEKMPKGVLEELQTRNPTTSNSTQRKYRHHQFLSPEIGQGHLRDHFLQLIPVMRLSKNWDEFLVNFEEIFVTPEIPD